MHNTAIPQPLYTRAWGDCHIQGIAVDRRQGYIYYSFTTKLVKATLQGDIVGCLDGLVGHLGCIAFNEQDGCVYGSLEYKNDAIGRGILHTLQDDTQFDDVFYLARFEVDKLTRLDQTADNSDVMTCVYLQEVVNDYTATGTDSNGHAVPHKYGCSGIDGLTFAPLPGRTAAEGMYAYVAYGIYRDVDRCDNDHQVLLCYDVTDWSRYARPLRQASLHTSGFAAPLHKFFVYTGNTTYGVQNLEYDAHTHAVYMAVYRGVKPQFPNYDLFAVDWQTPPRTQPLTGLDESGEVLCLKAAAACHAETGISGWRFPYGSTGMASLGNGEWLFCEPRKNTQGQCGYIFQYVWDGTAPFVTKGIGFYG